ERPISVYEVHLGSFMRPSDADGDFYNYREIAEKLADYVKKLGYTHVELLPIMEHPFDGSWGYQVTGYYAPTSRFGNPEDFMYFVDYLHKNGIGVILDWVPAHFPKDSFGLAKFDGTCLYEHQDPRQGEHPHWGTLIYNYHRPEVSNFLIGNAMYWVEKYHVDGIRIDAVASMLYLDYGKNDGEWIPNCFGGKENLDAIELLKHLNSMMKKRNPGTLMIAEESTAWPMVSGDVENGGLGFQLKWNMGFMNDFLGYMKQDPLFRKGNHNALTFSMMYAYSERFILVFSHDEVVHGKGSMIGKMPGSYEDKFANLRAGYGYTYGHPGKKLLFMGQEFAQFAEWNENKALDWNLVSEYEMHQKMQTYVSELNKLYTGKKAMYEADYYNDGFKWINCNDWQRSYVTFYRQSKDGSNLLVFICNFTPVHYDEFTLGVPVKGSYKEILNSDDTKFGGKGNVNSKIIKSKEQEWDGFDNSITVTLPGLSTLVLEFKNPVKKAKAEAEASKTGKNSKKA
ncbi:MAG: 1,4-alpha-glucan branching protein GlgB, partial [Lachnospiraceae bacterium]|nr:1,4-alpha-glucan branching protein GlgB [Lachnospiraceae bacterium]